MSQLGQFAKRYEQVQRGLQDMAERQLAVHRRSESSVYEEMQRLSGQKNLLQTELRAGKTGLAWQETWQQLQVLEVRELELERELQACRERIELAQSEVRRTYQEAERFNTLATRETNRERFEQERQAIQLGDDLAVQGYGRGTP